MSISSNKPAGYRFTRWSGDTQYLTGAPEEEFNVVKIPDVAVITLTANWTSPASPPSTPSTPEDDYTPPSSDGGGNDGPYYDDWWYVYATDLHVKIENGKIMPSGATEGIFDEGDIIYIQANEPPPGWIFTHWQGSNNSTPSGEGKAYYAWKVGHSDETVTANYRELIYRTLTVKTASGTTTEVLESKDIVHVDARPIPENYELDYWTGDLDGMTKDGFYRFI